MAEFSATLFYKLSPVSSALYVCLFEYGSAKGFVLIYNEVFHTPDLMCEELHVSVTSEINSVFEFCLCA